MIPELVKHFDAHKGIYEKVVHQAYDNGISSTANSKPSAYVFIGSTNSQEPDSLRDVIQFHRRIIEVATICDVKYYDQAQEDMFCALLGWQFNKRWTGLYHIEGKPISSIGTTLVYVDYFASRIVLNPKR